MKNLIYIITLFSVPLFFGITSILGISYGGAESSNLYRNYCIIIFVISMTFILFGKQKRSPNGHSSTIIYWVLFIYIINGYFTGYTKDRGWLALIAFSFPAACIGKYYANDCNNSLFKMAKHLDLLFVILTVCVISLSINLTSAVVVGDREYSQSLSYYSALSFLLDVFLLFYGKSFERLKFFKSKLIRIVYLCLLPVLIMIIFYAGGRGGFVVVAVGTLAIAFLYRKRRLTSWLWVVATSVTLSMLIPYVKDNASIDVASTFDKNQKRVFAYIKYVDPTDEEESYTPIKIDMTETSGRDDVYKESWDMFLERPATGYGLFRYKRILMYNYKMPYPHNLFLEWLLQGGILFFCIWFYVVCKMLIRLHRLIKHDKRYIVLLPFVVYAIVQLMFSGSYMQSSFFWFALSFSLNKKVSNHKFILNRDNRFITA